MNKRNADPMVRTGTRITGGIAALAATTLLVACGPSKSETQEYSDSLPSWIDGSHNICAVELGQRFDSLAAVDTELTKDDSGFQGESVLVSAQDGHIGQVVNLNVANPRTEQHAGDKVLANHVSATACRMVGGEYSIHPQIVAPPSGTIGE